MFPSDAFAAERDVFNSQINKPHFTNTLLQPGESPTQVSVWPERPFNRGFEVVELDGFDEMLGEAGLQTSFDIAVIAKTADRNPWNIRDRADVHHQIHSGSIRKSNIADEQIEFVANGSFHGRADVVCHGNQMSATRQQFLQSSAGVVVIVDQQNL